MTDEEGVVGLVAYALFKKAIREEAASGAAPRGRYPQPLRHDSKDLSGGGGAVAVRVIGRAIDQATPEIQQSAVLAAISGTAAQIESHVTRRTGFGSALLTNIVARALTLAIAVFVLFLAARPGVEQTMANAAGGSARSQRPPTRQ